MLRRLNTVEWWREFRQPMLDIARPITTHDLRVSMHPGQYTVLSAKWLVLENDERLFGMDAVLAAAGATGVPVVMDVFHHRVHAGADADETLPDMLHRAAATWRAQRDGAVLELSA